MMENLVKFSGFYAGGQHRKEGSSPHPAIPPPPPPMEGKEILRGWDFSLFTADTINFRIIV